MGLGVEAGEPHHTAGPLWCRSLSSAIGAETSPPALRTQLLPTPPSFYGCPLLHIPLSCNKIMHRHLIEEVSVTGKEAALTEVLGEDESHSGQFGGRLAVWCVVHPCLLQPIQLQGNQVPVSAWGSVVHMEDAAPSWPQGKGRRARGVPVWGGYICKTQAYSALSNVTTKPESHVSLIKCLPKKKFTPNFLKNHFTHNNLRNLCYQKLCHVKNYIFL